MDIIGSDHAELPKQSSLIYYLIQMLISFGQNLSFQFLPIYARKLGADPRQMGFLTSLQNIFSTLFSPFFGKQSDEYGRKYFIAAGTFVAAGAGVGMALSNNAIHILFATAIASIGVSILTPAWAGAMADYTESNIRGRGGFIGRIMGVGSGFVTLMLLGFYFLEPYLKMTELQEYKMIMWFSAGNFIIVCVISYFLIDVRQGKRSSNKLNLLEPWYDPRFRRAMSVILLWWLLMSFAWSYFPLVISDILKLSASQVAIIGAMQTITQTVASYKGADLIDRIGAKKATIIGFLPFSMVPLFFAISTVWWHLLLAQFVGGMGIGFGFASLQVYILNVAGAEKSGTYMGFYNVSYGILTFFGSLGGGFFMQWYASQVGLNVALFNALIAIAIMRFLSNFLMIKFLPDDK
ncbi:MAG: MFS transporter [Candidatus Heimdallarchaeota archaeon]|nr:MFS transporter [Candidatus Heimdallarchaeota archaeon]